MVMFITPIYQPITLPSVTAPYYPLPFMMTIGYVEYFAELLEIDEAEGERFLRAVLEVSTEVDLGLKKAARKYINSMLFHRKGITTMKLRKKKWLKVFGGSSGGGNQPPHLWRQQV